MEKKLKLLDTTIKLKNKNLKDQKSGKIRANKESELPYLFLAYLFFNILSFFIFIPIAIPVFIITSFFLIASIFLDINYKKENVKILGLNKCAIRTMEEECIVFIENERKELFEQEQIIEKEKNKIEKEIKDGPFLTQIKKLGNLFKTLLIFMGILLILALITSITI